MRVRKDSRIACGTGVEKLSCPLTAVKGNISNERKNNARHQDRIFHRTLKKEWSKISHGEGIYLFDTEGNRYLDACAGVHVVSIGHGIKEIAEVMAEQAEKVCFTTPDSSRSPRSIWQTESPTSAGRPEPGLFCFRRVRSHRVGHENCPEVPHRNRQSRKYRVISRWQACTGIQLAPSPCPGGPPWREDYIPYLLNFPHIPPPYPYRCAYCKDHSECQLHCAEELERVIKQEGSESISAFIADRSSAPPPPV